MEEWRRARKRHREGVTISLRQTERINAETYSSACRQLDAAAHRRIIPQGRDHLGNSVQTGMKSQHRRISNHGGDY